jgi:hypothetical protein
MVTDTRSNQTRQARAAVVFTPSDSTILEIAVSAPQYPAARPLPSPTPPAPLGAERPIPPQAGRASSYAGYGAAAWPTPPVPAPSPAGLHRDGHHGHRGLLPEPRNGFGITALVLAIIGLVSSLVPLTGFLATILGVLAVVFGLLGLGRVQRRIATNRALTIVGTVLGLIAMLIGIIGMVIVFKATAQLGRDLAGIGTQPGRTSEDHEYTLGDIRPLSRENVD